MASSCHKLVHTLELLYKVMPMYLYIINISVLLVLYMAVCTSFIVQEVKVKVAIVHCHDCRLPLEARKNACMDCASDNLKNLKPTEHFQNNSSTFYYKLHHYVIQGQARINFKLPDIQFYSHQIWTCTLMRKINFTEVKS